MYVSHFQFDVWEGNFFVTWFKAISSSIEKIAAEIFLQWISEFCWNFFLRVFKKKYAEKGRKF